MAANSKEEIKTGIIYCILGKSGSGKDTVFKEILKRANIKPVVTYTTRPMRIDEINGVDYNFIDNNMLSEFEKQNKVIEDRYYNTINGIWSYATIDDGNIDLTSGDYIIISTLDAYNKISSYFGRKNVKPIYINVEDGIRLERSLKRERSQRYPGYAEMCRRFLADCEDFRADKLEAANIKNIYNNINVAECVSEIMEKEGLKNSNTQIL